MAMEIPMDFPRPQVLGGLAALLLRLLRRADRGGLPVPRSWLMMWEFTKWIFRDKPSGKTMGKPWENHGKT